MGRTHQVPQYTFIYYDYPNKTRLSRNRKISPIRKVSHVLEEELKNNACQYRKLQGLNKNLQPLSVLPDVDTYVFRTLIPSCSGEREPETSVGSIHDYKH